MKKLFFLLLLLISFINGVSQPVSIRKAKTLAKNHYFQNDNSKIRVKYDDIDFSGEYALKSGNDTLYFIFNIAKNRGFVIISADERSYPIIGYSYTGGYSESDLPPAFAEWMELRKKEIIKIKEKNTPASSSITSKWNEIKNAGSGVKSIAGGPLLQTTWNQSCYYNEMCPAEAAGACGHTLTGCLATATAQILRYWSYPNQGTGSHSYSNPPYGTLSANYGATTYNWSNMPNSINSTNPDIATLMFHCGVAFNMDYGTSVSLPTVTNPRAALISYFNYSSKAKYIVKSDYTNTAWQDILKTEIDSLRPVYYYGAAISTAHSFLCDGYQGSDFFHFNWGWGGAYDGYFYLTSLNPGGDNYSNSQSAVIRIFPSSGAFAFTTSATAIGIRDAVLNGIVRPDGLVTTVSFEYGTTTNYGSTITTAQNPVSGTSDTPVNANLSALLPNTIYHFRVKAVNTNGTFYGSDFSFLTKSDIWNEQISGTLNNLRSVFFVNSNVGYVTGDGGIILKTTDGGNTWIPQTSSITNNITGVYFLTEDIGWAVGYGGKILKTVNGGTNWTAGSIGTTTNLYSVFFIDANHGWVGSESKILKTTNGGTSWSSSSIGSGAYPVYSIFFTSSTLGFAAGWYVNMLSTTNSGTNWYGSDTSPSSAGFYSLHFPAPETGFSCGAAGYIYKYTSPTWNKLESGTVNDLKSIFFTDNNSGYTVGNGGIILKTKNSGTDWSPSSSGTENNLNCVCFSDSFNGWCVGDNGVILHTMTGGESCSNLSVTGHPGSADKCVGDDVTLSVSVDGIAPAYQWKKDGIEIAGAKNSSLLLSDISLSDAGNYTCYIQNPCSNVTSETAHLTVNEKPAIPTISFNDNILHSDAPLGNQWYYESGLINGATNQDYTASYEGDYYLIVTLSGCSSDASNTIKVVLTDNESVTDHRMIRVYPNPFSNELSIEMEGNTVLLNFEIINANGQIVFKGNFVESTVIPTSNLAPGVYLLKLGNGKIFEFRKIIKN